MNVEKLKEQVIDLYINHKLSGTKIANKLKITVGQVFYILEKYKIPRRTLSNAHIRHEYDRNYFNRIDTEEKAYFLGFFYADGNVHKNVVKMCLHEKDEEFIIKFKNAIKTEKDIVKYKNFKQLTISSEDLANQFRKLGCHERKTFTLKFPKETIVPSYLIRHFMRGYFDGDGSIHYNIQKKSNQICWSFEVISCFSFLYKYQSVLFKACEIEINELVREKRREKPIFYMRHGSTSNITLLKIFDFLYKDATIYLTRKYNKFIEINNLIISKIKWRKLNPIGIPPGELENVKKILIENNDKPLWYVCKILNRKDQQSLSDLYKRLNIKRNRCVKKSKNHELYRSV